MSQLKSRTILGGDDLIAALAKTMAPVKWIRRGSSGLVDVVLISSAMAIPIARAGIYEGKCNGGRVLLIREQGQKEEDDRRRFVVDASFSSGRGIRRYFGDQRSRPGRYYTCEFGHLCYGRPRRAGRSQKFVCKCPAPRS